MSSEIIHVPSTRALVEERNQGWYRAAFYGKSLKEISQDDNLNPDKYGTQQISLGIHKHAGKFNLPLPVRFKQEGGDCK